MFEVSAGELVAQLGGELLGDGGTRIRRIAPLENAGADSISFLSNPRFQAQLAGSGAGCVIVGPSMRELVVTRPSAIVSAEPYLYFARLTQWWKGRTRPVLPPGVHPSAVIEPIFIHLVAYDPQDADRLGMSALGPEGRRAALRGAFPRLTAKELGSA